LKVMKPGSVIVDVAVDQGRLHRNDQADDARPADVRRWTASSTTLWRDMPGGVPRTSTLALTNATLPYARGWRASDEAGM